MANPVARSHSELSQFEGTIHFRGPWAYLENVNHSDWSLLQFDSPFTGVMNPAAAETTASKLRNSYKESDPVRFQGVLCDESFGAVAFSVLFVGALDS